MILVTLALSLVLLAASIAVHYEVLRQASRRLVRVRAGGFVRLTLVLFAILLSHLVHVLIWALAFEGVVMMGWGSIEGQEVMTFHDAYYFSITSYTTLGIGDLAPYGMLRILSGVESLTGLVMVGWSASFTYLYMEKFWHIRGRPGRH
ncbi:potassium channel family protein [Sphingomicrobium arenosum]|uniref:potassium channel family protein n=1 Tax=Sphingomicrobium arenosum TaxID=2233861 RepID=UPI00223ECDCA|nr:potassium channel family protein [Sphingomicrobium arenosum]